MLLSEIESIFEQFEPNDNLFVTLKRTNGDVWLENEPIISPYPASAFGLDKNYDLPTIIIPSKGWQQFYTVFPVERIIDFEVGNNPYLILSGPKGYAIFVCKD